MSLIQVNCKNCGANIQIDNSRERAFCSYCGAQYIYEKPISLHIENINIGNIPALQKTSNFSFDIQEYAIPFVKKENQAKSDWLNFIMAFDDAPIDVAYKAKIISITKEYYPVAFFDVTCTAEWTAVSYWEHDEPYNVVEKRGDEYKTVTKYKTIVDGVQQTNGKVFPTTHTVRVSMGPEADGSFGSELASWIDLDTTCIDVNSDYLKDYYVYPVSRKREEAIKIAENYAHQQMNYLAKDEVPGTRYENLKVTSFVEDNKMTTRYVALYKVKYEYAGTNYEYCTPGITSEKCWSNDHPTDKTIQKRVNELQRRVERIKKWPWIVGLIVAPIPFYLLGSAFNSIGAWLFIGGIYASFLFMLIYSIMSKENAIQHLNTYKSINERMKKQIHDLVHDKNTSEENKNAKIEEWIKTHSTELNKAESAIIESNKSDMKKFIVIFSICVVAVFGLVIGTKIIKSYSETRSKAIAESEAEESRLIAESERSESIAASESERLESFAIYESEVAASRAAASETANNTSVSNAASYATKSFESLTFEIPSNSIIADENSDHNDAFSNAMVFSFPTEGSGIILYSLDLSENDVVVNEDSEEYTVSITMQDFLRTNNATNIQLFDTSVDGMIAKAALCNFKSAPSEVFVFCSKDYSKVYIVLYQVFNSFNYSEVDKEYLEHFFDSITVQ